MNKKLSPAFVELTQDALLKAIWFKGSLRMFLIQHQISESALAQWSADQSKREFIEWLWPRLRCVLKLLSQVEDAASDEDEGHE